MVPSIVLNERCREDKSFSPQKAARLLQLLKCSKQGAIHNHPPKLWFPCESDGYEDHTARCLVLAGGACPLAAILTNPGRPFGQICRSRVVEGVSELQEGCPLLLQAPLGGQAAAEDAG
ncbi:hypothetical protein Taro_038390 [Colocasia esculenta]|uniref:Uncharacterized protein n=1 Tax=Colocasia esculenta TaxID=4460 RepID=A0A843WJ52_COLES|nr:hypothetical protein [Colocasia esculenta]